MRYVDMPVGGGNTLLLEEHGIEQALPHNQHLQPTEVLALKDTSQLW